MKTPSLLLVLVILCTQISCGQENGQTSKSNNDSSTIPLKKNKTAVASPPPTSENPEKLVPPDHSITKKPIPSNCKTIIQTKINQLKQNHTFTLSYKNSVCDTINEKKFVINKNNIAIYQEDCISGPTNAATMKLESQPSTAASVPNNMAEATNGTGTQTACAQTREGSTPLCENAVDCDIKGNSWNCCKIANGRYIQSWTER